MTAAKIKEALAFYRECCNEGLERVGGTEPQRADPEQLATALTVEQRRAHLAWMCEHAASLVDQGRLEKAQRHLAFVQGVLWRNGRFTALELGTHVMPDGTAPDRDMGNTKR